MIDNVVVIDQLQKSYANFKLNEISFTIPKGYITGFIGPNGSGKTTTMKLILDLIKKDGGEINIFGESQVNQDYMTRIGVVLDKLFLVKDWTISEVESIIGPFYSSWDIIFFGII